MDPVTQRMYLQEFVAAVATRTDNEYQKLFEDIMEMRFPNDFVRVRPAGKEGDWKCDGFLRSAGTVFQVYAPSSPLNISKLTTKMRKDYLGSRTHWKTQMRSWIFHHNQMKGTYPQVLGLLQELYTQHKDVELSIEGPSYLRSHMLALNEVDLQVLFGVVPTMSDYSNLRYEHIEAVLSHVATTQGAIGDDVRPVPPDKVKYNNLSDDSVSFLELGMPKSDIVRRYFTQHPDPSLGDQVAAVYAGTYEQLKIAGYNPDDIFGHLYHDFVSSLPSRSPSTYAAAHAMLSYFFEECDIFERPLDGLQHATPN